MTLADKLRAEAEERQRAIAARVAARACNMDLHCNADVRWAYVNGRAVPVRFACEEHRQAVREHLMFFERDLWTPDLVEVAIEDADDVRPWKVIDDAVPWQIEFEDAPGRAAEEEEGRGHR
jgi:hypothetical protein